LVINQYYLTTLVFAGLSARFAALFAVFGFALFVCFPALFPMCFLVGFFMNTRTSFVCFLSHLQDFFQTFTLVAGANFFDVN